MTSSVLEGIGGKGIVRTVTININVSDLIARGVHLTMTSISTSWIRFVSEVPASAQVPDIFAQQHWAALLSDPDSLAMLEEMAADALAEDAAGLTRDLDELL